MTEQRPQPPISIAALARAAGVSHGVASAWLRSERQTRTANEAALDAAFARLMAEVANNTGPNGFFEALLRALPGPPPRHWAQRALNKRERAAFRASAVTPSRKLVT